MSEAEESKEAEYREALKAYGMSLDAAAMEVNVAQALKLVKWCLNEMAENQSDCDLDAIAHALMDAQDELEGALLP